MSVADEIRALQSRKGPQCVACKAISKLTPTQRREFAKVVEDDELTKKAMAKWLSLKGGIEVPDFTFRHHVDHKHGAA